ncbi:MAG: ribonuclease P protein component 1 [Candidatus Micrarchaeota archaeon]|nr:ribonuclease P protein component 1 [Candidatus Micrarchaeota archaeon]
MITESNIRIHELIGLKVKVAKSLSLAYQGIRGIVADETKNTILIRTRGGEKRIPKKGCIFVFQLPGGRKAEVDGNTIAYRPFDRPKKLR